MRRPRPTSTPGGSLVAQVTGGKRNPRRATLSGSRGGGFGAGDRIRTGAILLGK